MILNTPAQRTTLLIKSLVLLAGLTIAATSHAINYDVEVIIFEHVRNTDVGSADTLLLPVVRGAQQIPAIQIDPNATSAAQDPNALIKPLTTLRLQDEATQIRESNNHRLVYHGGWRQTDFSQEAAPYMRIAFGSSVQMFTERGDADSQYLNGYTSPPVNRATDQKRATTLYGGVKVWVGRFLHFDTLLAYTPQGGTRSFAMQSERRMRSRQLHYIDNPRFGIITKIFPVDETAAN